MSYSSEPYQNHVGGLAWPRPDPLPLPRSIGSSTPQPRFTQVMANNSKEEPNSAPQPGRWFDLTLGPSFASDSSSKFCTLRYEFKPASIDKTKPGSLHKTKDNRVTVEFQNNQSGKPKVTFDGSSEDYKENDAVLFFDGSSFRLERLHRAVKQLRLRRDPGESAAAMADPTLSPGPKASKPMPKARTSLPPVPVEVERIDIGEPDNPGAKGAGTGITDHQSEPLVDPPIVHAPSPGVKEDEADDHQDFDIDDIFGEITPEHNDNMAEPKTDIGADYPMQQQNDSDDEIADVENSGDEAEKGTNAAEALRAQVNARKGSEPSSCSSSSSDSGSSGSGSSSSGSGASDEDSVNSI